MLTMLDAQRRLDEFWASHGAMTAQPMNTEVGAGTLNPATFLRVLGPEPWRVGYVEPSVRPDDARYGLNPNRIQKHTQYQVILKPDPGDAQDLYLASLGAIGIDVGAHDVRFVEDNWASPAIGAWGLGWEVWLDGLEITQFTYFQQAGGQNLDPVSVEITYGIERILMALQGVRHFKDITYAPGITYGELFGQDEYEMSRYVLDEADVDATRAMLQISAEEAARLVDAGLPVPAYAMVLKCSHAFNVLDARGAISQAERAREFARMRGLAGRVAQLWVAARADAGHPLGVSAATPLAPVPAPPTDEYQDAGGLPREFVLEVGTEEMPPREAAAAAAQLLELVKGRLSAGRLAHGEVRTFHTARRLVVRVATVDARESDHESVLRGPKVEAAFDGGVPTAAGAGFARSKGVAPEELSRVTVDGVEHVALVRHTPGRSAEFALADLVADCVQRLRSSNNMRWSDPALSFTRPIRWLLALWGDRVVPAAVGSLEAGRTTRMLRTDDPATKTVAQAEDYAATLADAGIVLDPAERHSLIAQAAVELAASLKAGVDLVREAALVDQLVGLVEAPTPLLGRFDESYLEMPDDVLVTVMRKHQRYLSVRDDAGALLPAFVVVANGHVDPDVVRAGNEAVLRARFEDALYFYRADRQVSLEDLLGRLGRLAFADRLGSMLDRAHRISATAERLAAAADLTAEERRHLDRARALVKVDLASDMVTELTSLAGVMAREYALRAGEDPEVAQALEEVELPRQLNHPGPRSRVGALLSVADRADYLMGLVATVGLPTGSSDQYAMRRAALGLIAVARSGLLGEDFSVRGALHAALDQPVALDAGTAEEVARFVERRLEMLLVEEGHAIGLVRAVLPHADVPARVDRLLAELEALEGSERLRSLQDTMQRVARILSTKGAGSQQGAGEDSVSALEATVVEPADSERGLAAVLDRVEASGHADLTSLVEGSADLPGAVDALFDEVMVLDPDPVVRAGRLGLLERVRGVASPWLDWDALARADSER